ncbi:MAG: RNA methyltransferase [Desulfuromonadales bacterium]|nr:RNA methyltransferase [Desulfuromonadales bacterium]
MPIAISSVQNPRVKAAVRLRERRGREEAGLLLIEGYEEVALAWECGVRPQELFFSPQLARPQEGELLAAMRQAGVFVLEVTPAVMEKLAYRQSPDGWLAVAPVPRRTLADLHLGPAPLLVVVEGVEKPGNLGAILRSADAAGVEAVIVCDPRTDLFNPNVVRASKGTVFQVPVVQAGSPETLDWLRRQGVRTVAATPAATQLHWQADLRGGIALAVGTEKEGLSGQWLERADLAVKIPMHGRVNSLNVAQALTVLVYEALRQRYSG